MKLTVVETHPVYGSAFEAHEFQCGSCGRTQSYTLRRRPAAAPALPFDAGRRSRPR
jgi:hypothetical protein